MIIFSFCFLVMKTESYVTLQQKPATACHKNLLCRQWIRRKVHREFQLGVPASHCARPPSPLLFVFPSPSVPWLSSSPLLPLLSRLNPQISCQDTERSTQPGAFSCLLVLTCYPVRALKHTEQRSSAWPLKPWSPHLPSILTSLRSPCSDQCARTRHSSFHNFLQFPG